MDGCQWPRRGRVMGRVMRKLSRSDTAYIVFIALRTFFVMNHAGCFSAELLSFFILFLPRGRKRTKQEKEDAARAKFACTPGAPPLGLKCLRRKRRETFDEL